jgi:hypothetical protein
MKRVMFIALALAAGQQAGLAAPGTVAGPGALALAAVVTQHSPLVRPYDKRVIARLFSGNTNFGFTPNSTVSVIADSVVCRVSNVDITSRSCDLTFKIGKRTVQGREANEIYGTLAAAGVAPQGAAGSIVESASNLACMIDPNEIRKKTGGGADCTFDPGQ